MFDFGHVHRLMFADCGVRPARSHVCACTCFCVYRVKRRESHGERESERREMNTETENHKKVERNKHRNCEAGLACVYLGRCSCWEEGVLL